MTINKMYIDYEIEIQQRLQKWEEAAKTYPLIANKLKKANDKKLIITKVVIGLIALVLSGLFYIKFRHHLACRIMGCSFELTWNIALLSLLHQLMFGHHQDIVNDTDNKLFERLKNESQVEMQPVRKDYIKNRPLA